MKRLSSLLMLSVTALILAGCGGMQSSMDSGGKSTSTGTTTNPWVDPNYSDSISNAGATVQLITNADMMRSFTGHPVAQADFVYLKVQLSNFQDENWAGHYSGYLSISYDNGGEQKNGVMWTGDADKDTQYNVWYNDVSTGKRIFHGFFEDEPPAYPYTQTAGGVILVIDDVTSLGDGQASLTSVSGSVWFKNYRTTYYAKPDTRCWFIQIGPYECQTWIDVIKGNNVVNPRKSIYPDNGYTKLGEFTGLNANDAFGIK